MRKVQIAGIVLLLAWLGCEPAPEPTRSEEAGIFGSAYEIVTNESPSLPDEPPALFGDTLSAMVVYPGGCADHEFELDAEVRSDTAWLWLRHSAGRDDCEALISDRIELIVPENVLTSRTILLLNPAADVPFVLRWGNVRAQD